MTGAAPALAAKDETAWLKKHSWPDFALVEFRRRPKGDARDEGALQFPMGDYTKLHRSAVIAIESRAAQNGHRDIAKASKKLLAYIDKTGG